MGSGSLVPKGRFISYLRVQKLIFKVCLYYLVHVKDSTFEGSLLQSVPVACEFPNDLTGVSPEREIDFGIVLTLDTYPISISPFRMAPIELKELK